MKEKILIVDDVSKNIQVAASILKEKQYDLSFALDGQSALQQVEQTIFDLILLDIMMPGLNGFEVCEQLKAQARSREIPIIFLTAKSNIESITRAFEVGGVDYITKPFHSSELLARVKTHLTLQQQKQELMTSNATKNKFFSIIAHDLRNALGGMLSASRLLAEYFQKDEVAQAQGFAPVLYESAESSYKLLENLLQWAKIQRDGIQAEPVDVDLAQLVSRDIFQTFAVPAQEKQITLHHTIPDKTYVYVDRHILETTIRNLISNAVKFTATGGEVRVQVVSNEQWVELSVIDSGIGISPEEAKKLFRLDTKCEKIGTAGEYGTGLGLILCKELLERNGGHIQLQSEVGEGTTFTVSIPLPGDGLGQTRTG